MDNSELLAGAALCGVISAAIASWKGRNMFGFLLLGTFVPFIGLPVAVFMKPNREELDRRKTRGRSA